LPKRKPPVKPVLSSKQLLLIRSGLLIAFAVSAYLAWIGLTNSAIPGCGPESDCDRVLGSRWSKLFNLPVSLFALVIYATTFYLLRGSPKRWKFLNALAAVILVSALWFVGLQIFSLHAYCKFCLTAHIAGALAALTLLWNSPLPWKTSFPYTILGAGAVALLILGQLQFPYTSPIKQYATSNSNSISLIKSAPPEANAQPSSPIFETLGGEVRIDVTKVPVMGNPNGSKKVLQLFDYTCHHCRKLHLLFQPLLRQYPELTVISLPMPLDANCNPSVRRTPAAHINSCDYAKLGLAVFVADPQKLKAYDDWFFSSETPPPLDAAKKYAETLVTPDAFTKAMLDPVPSQQLNQDIQIYILNNRMSRSQGQLPQMLFPEGAHLGPVETTTDLEQILKSGIGL